MTVCTEGGEGRERALRVALLNRRRVQYSHGGGCGGARLRCGWRDEGSRRLLTSDCGIFFLFLGFQEEIGREDSVSASLTGSQMFDISFMRE